MKEKKNITGELLLLCAAAIWGGGFVAQSIGMDYVGPFTFNSMRFFIAGIVLIPCRILISKINNSQNIYNYDNKSTYIGGILCGIILSVATLFQQYGLLGASVGKAGFITALYIIIVPLLGIFLHKAIGIKIWIACVIAICGMYLLCIGNESGLDRYDILLLICAFIFSIHIMVIDHFSKMADCILMSCIQFFVAGIVAMIGMLVFEKPHISDICNAWQSLLYAGAISGCAGYTLQILGQKNVKPAIASLLLSLESVFSVIAGFIFLGQSMSMREIIGCILMFAAIILAQI